MKKNIERSILCSIFFVLMLLVFGKTNAATLSVNYNGNEEINRAKSYKLYPGDEVFVSFTADGTDAEKIMAIYGKIEYDENVLELIDSTENIYSGNLKTGDGWSTGNLDSTNNVFFFYSLNDDRGNTAGYMRFKVKSEITKSTSTVFEVKDIILYEGANNNGYKQLSSDVENVSLKIKINNKSQDRIIMIVVASILIILIVAVIVIIKKNKSKRTDEREENENDEIKEEQQSDENKK